jgi:hypothetical protein
MRASLPTNASSLGWLVLLGSLHTAVLYVLMYGSIGKLPTGTVALVSYLYPVVAVVVDIVAYGHRVTPVEAAGMVAVLGAALARSTRRPAVAADNATTDPSGSVVGGSGVVLEDQSADGDQQQRHGNDKQPQLPERQ